MSTFLSAFLFSNFPLKKPAHYALPVTVSVFPRPTFQSLPHSSHIKQSKCHRNHRDLPTSWIPISIILFFPEAVVNTITQHLREEVYFSSQFHLQAISQDGKNSQHNYNQEQREKHTLFYTARPWFQDPNQGMVQPIVG